jgi:hypothetical protein
MKNIKSHAFILSHSFQHSFLLNKINTDAKISRSNIILSAVLPSSKLPTVPTGEYHSEIGLDANIVSQIRGTQRAFETLEVVRQSIINKVAINELKTIRAINDGIFYISAVSRS